MSAHFISGISPGAVFNTYLPVRLPGSQPLVAGGSKYSSFEASFHSPI
jgi:hypothetical protein